MEPMAGTATARRDRTLFVCAGLGNDNEHVGRNGGRGYAKFQRYFMLRQAGYWMPRISGFGRGQSQHRT